MAEMLCLEMIKTIFVPYFPGIAIYTVNPIKCIARYFIVSDINTYLFNIY